MTKRKYTIMTILVLVCSLLLSSFAYADTVTNEEYQSALNACQNAEENVKIKTQELEAANANEAQTDWTTFLKKYNVNINTVERSLEKLKQINNNVTLYEQTIAQKQSEIAEAQNEYDNKKATWNDGAFSFLPWVIQNYPQYKEDAEEALQIYQNAVEDGYSIRGDEYFGPSIPNLKKAIEYLYQYVELKEYFKDDDTLWRPMNMQNIDKTSFSLNAHAHYNIGHTTFESFGHLKEYLKRYQLGENIVFAESYTSFLRRQGEITTLPKTGVFDPYPNIQNDLPWLFTSYGVGYGPFFLWFICEKSAIDSGIPNTQDGIDFGHYLTILRYGHSGVAVMGSKGDNVAQDFGSTYYTDICPPILTISEYEAILNEYLDTIGLEEAESRLTNLQRLKAAHENALIKNQAILQYLQAAVPVTLASEALAQAEQELEEARANYEAIRAQFESENPVSPSDVNVKNTDSYIELSWTAVATPGVRYRIYRKEPEGDWKELATTPITRYRDTTAEKGAAYDYKIVSYNKKSESGEDAERVVATRLDAPVPSSTLTFNWQSSVVNFHLQISWPKVEGATSYAIYRRAEGGEWELYKEQSGATLKIYGADYTSNTTGNKMPYNQRYQYAVKAKSEYSESELNTANAMNVSIPQMITVSTTIDDVPYQISKGAVKNLTTGKSADLPSTTEPITLTWNKADGNSNVRYDIYRMDYNRDFAPRKIGSVVGSRASFTDAETYADSKFTYYVVPIVGNQSLSLK